jgi:hypothetical protein
MKNVVIQTKEKHAVILASDGTFRKVSNKGYKMGQVFQTVRTAMMRKAVAVAAAAVIFLSGGTALAYYTPVGCATVDINPSIEFHLNLFGRVIGARGVNEDGEALLARVETGADLGQNIKAVVCEAVAEGYLPEDGENTIIVTVSGPNEAQAQQEAEEAGEQAQEALEETGTDGDVEADRVGYDRVREARRLGTTPGKLNLVQKYMDSVGEGVVVDVNEWLKKPVKEIMKAIKENRKASKAGKPAVPKATPAPTECPPTAVPGQSFTPVKADSPKSINANRNEKSRHDQRGKHHKNAKYGKGKGKKQYQNTKKYKTHKTGKYTCFSGH